MMAIHLMANSSPLGSNGLPEKEEVPTRSLRGLIRSSFSRNYEERKENAENTLLHIKVSILQKNPELYKMFQATLADFEF